MREKRPSGEADGAKPSTLKAVESAGLTDVTSGCRRRPLTRVPLMPPLPVPLCMLASWLLPLGLGMKTTPIPRDTKASILPSIPSLVRLQELQYLCDLCHCGVSGVEMARDTPEVVLQWGKF